MKHIWARIGLVALFVLTIALGFHSEGPRAEKIGSYFGIEAVDWWVVEDSSGDTAWHIGSLADFDSSDAWGVSTPIANWDNLTLQVWSKPAWGTGMAPASADSNDVRIYLMASNDAVTWIRADSATITDTLPTATGNLVEFTMPKAKYAMLVMRGIIVDSAGTYVRMKAYHYGVQ